MTGLWQISGRSDLSFDDLVRLDFYYLENWSIWLDITILAKTVPAVIVEPRRILSFDRTPRGLRRGRRELRAAATDYPPELVEWLAEASASGRAPLSSTSARARGS